MPLSESLEVQALRELKSETCAVCDKSKTSGNSFCKSCYFSLPEKTRHLLYTPMSEGYATIYDEAKDDLRTGRV